MNAIEFLLAEHNAVKKTLNDIASPSHRHETRVKDFKQLSFNLIRHEKMEHKVWYPNFKDSPQLDKTVHHLLKEEDHAEKAIKHILKITDPDEWNKSFSKFKDDVLHHAHEEETKLFPKVKNILDENTLNEIGKKMHLFKQQYEG